MQLKQETSFGWILACVAWAVLTVDFCIFWGWHGGWVNTDTFMQWNQAQSGAYTNWHPFVHTFLMMKVPSLILDNYVVTILWQMLLFSGVFGYVGATCLRCGFTKKATVLVLMCVLLHPQTLFFLMTPLKDTGFAIAVLLAMAALVRIYRSQGAVIGKCSVWGPLAVGLVLAALFRHNGILFSGMAILLLLVLYVRRWTRPVLVCVAAVMLLYGGCRWGLGCLLHVQPASKYEKQYAFVESAGLPLTLMGAVYVRHPDEVSPDARAILDSIRPREVWLERYQDGSFNVVKYAGLGTQYSDKVLAGVPFDGWGKFAGICWRTLSLDPTAAMRAFVCLTDQVWSPLGGVRADSLLFPLQKIGLRGDLTLWLKVLRVVAIPLLGVCACVTWCLVATFFWVMWRRKWNVLLLALPVLSYNFGTMCFLSGFNMMRFFFFNVLVAGLLFLCWRARNQSPRTTENMV